MATVAYSTMINEIAPHVAGCPDPVIEAYIRKVVIDMCERGQIWRVRLADQVLLTGIHAYPLASPVAETEVSTILQAQMTVSTSGNVKVMEVLSDGQVRAMYPTWPDVTKLAEPRAITRYEAQAYHTVPVPDAVATYTMSIFATIRPTIDSTGWEDTLFNEYRRAVFHGVLHELMVMPDRPWSDDKLALYHGKQWSYHLYNAKARVNKGFGTAPVSVRMNPWA